MSTSHAFSPFTLLLSVVSVVLVGCVPDLPETLEVAVSAADKATAPRGSGPLSLADSSWTLFRDADPASAGKQFPPGPYGGLLNGGILERPSVDGQIFVVDVAADGHITEVRENEFLLPSIYGTEVPVGEEWAPSTLPFLRFRSATYGVDLGERMGLAVVVQVQFAGIYVGRSIIYAWGTVEDDRADGTFGYLLDFTGGAGDLVLDTGGDQYPFYAVPVP